MFRKNTTKFLLYFTRDYFDIGDILSCGSGECKVIGTGRPTWLKRFLIWLGFKININSRERVIYKVKLLK